MSRQLTLIFLLLMLSVSAFAQVSAVPQLMNFQGRLAKPDGTPVPDGNYSIRFSLWDTLSGGTEKWNQILNVTAHNGIFGVLFSGFPTNTFNDSLWLEIKIGTNAPLTPRQQLVSVAYAMKANSVADGAITGESIANGSITADKFAAGAFNPLAWLLGGNSGTNPDTNFLGTTDNQPLIFKVDNHRALQMQNVQYEGGGSIYLGNNLLSGYWLNSITDGVTQATLFGGGKIDIELPNRVTDIAGTVSGGIDNQAGNNNASVTDAAYSTVGGGENNTASGGYATVSGGRGNTASAFGATVPGGIGNDARAWASFAAGSGAHANHDGSFVWADFSGFAEFASTAANQFNVRASGGVRIFSKADLSTGVTLAANDGAWNSVSDRNAKTDFRDIDTLAVLERLVTIPITTWNYKGAENGMRHIGPMAQDFFAAFNVGVDDKHISTIDADGVALAAIQGLNRKLEASNATFKAENAELKAILADVLRRLEKVEANDR